MHTVNRRSVLAVKQCGHERGTAMVEFVLCFGIFWLPLFLGLSVFGFSLIRGIQTTTVCRDAGHMYAFGTDFSQPAGQTLLSNIGIGMDLSSTGNAKVILSTVTYIDASDCQNAGLQADSSHCHNFQKYVFTRRVIVPPSGGLTFSSAFGTPNGVTLDSSGGVSSPDQLNNTGVQLSANFPTVSGITLVSGQVTYVSEMYAQSLKPITWSRFSNPGTGARAYF